MQARRLTRRARHTGRRVSAAVFGGKSAFFWASARAPRRTRGVGESGHYRPNRGFVPGCRPVRELYVNRVDGRFTRKGDLDPASARGFGHPDPAAVQVHRPAGDGQAQTGAAVAARTVRRRDAAAAEPLEDPVDRCACGMPGPSSSTSSSRLSGPLPRRARTVTRPLRRAVPDRVVDQVRDHLVQPLGVRVRRSARAARRPGAGARRCGSASATPDRRAAGSMLAAFSTPDRNGHTSNRWASSGTTPLSSRDRSSRSATSRPSRSVCSSAARIVSGSAAETPSTTFSSTARSAGDGRAQLVRDVGHQLLAVPVGRPPGRRPCG